MAPRKKKEKKGGGKPSKVSSDHQRRIQLNDLPHNVIDEILTLLPIKDAVGTSFISRFWRSRWKSIPDLIFNNASANFVTHALLLHSGNIRTFKFTGRHFPLIDCWLVALSSRAADSLHSLVLGFRGDDDRYHVHSAAFSFCHLTFLSFCNCRITPPCDFSGFKHLVDIRLEDVYVPDGSQLSSLLSSSPCLKSVSLILVYGRGCLKIHGPNIHYLCYKKVIFHDFLLGSCPLLKRANIYLPLAEDGESYNDGEELDKAQWLALGRHGSKNLATHGIPERNPINFDNLSAMSLRINFTDLRSISANISLIKSCPNLKDLQIECFMHKYKIEVCEEIWGEQVNFDIFPKLQTAKFHGIRLEDSELQLVLLILETARVLQCMVLNLFTPSYMVRESAFIKMLEVRRASNEARILFNT